MTPRIEFEEDKQDRILVKQRKNSAEIDVDIDDYEFPNQHDQFIYI
jgi:hypothetical protein